MQLLVTMLTAIISLLAGSVCARDLAEREVNRLAILERERSSIAERLSVVDKVRQVAEAARLKADLDAIDREIGRVRPSVAKTPNATSGAVRHKSATHVAASLPRERTNSGEFPAWDVFKNFEKKESQQ